nr:MAG TPA: hypothetical protein [Caudoviricetes sp.]
MFIAFYQVQFCELWPRATAVTTEIFVIHSSTWEMLDYLYRSLQLSSAL